MEHDAEQVVCRHFYHHSELHAVLRYDHVGDRIQKGRDDHTAQTDTHSASESGDSFSSRPRYEIKGWEMCDFRGGDEVEELDDESTDGNERGHYKGLFADLEDENIDENDGGENSHESHGASDGPAAEVLALCGWYARERWAK